MNLDPTARVPVNLMRPLLAAATMVAVAAGFVLASEIVLILFLGILFGVFLTKTASQVAGQLQIRYRAALAVIVISLLSIAAGATTFFFVQINEQIEAASEKIDEGMSELRGLIGKYPALNSTLASTPVISDALGVKSDSSSDGNASGSGKKSESETTNQENQNSNDQSGLQLDQIPKPASQVAASIGQMFKTTFGLMVNSLLIFFLGLFLAVSPHTYRDGTIRLVTPAKRDRCVEVFDATGDALWRWLIGRFGSMLATGVGAFLLLVVLGVPLAGTLGILTALLTFIPNIGAAVALLLAVLFALPQGIGTVAIVIGGYMALQLIESYVVTPLIQQKAVSLPPALLIAFQAVMGVLFGFIGAAVASPLLAAGKTIVQMLYIEDYLESSEKEAATSTQ